MPATRSIRLKVRSESYRWLNAAAREVNTVWNWCNATSIVGDWWLCLPVQVEVQESAVQGDAVGIDLGLKDVAVTSDGERLEAGRWTERYAYKLAQARRRAHRRTARRIHRQIARCRGDALHNLLVPVARGRGCPAA
jgi:transposase